MPISIIISFKTDSSSNPPLQTSHSFTNTSYLLQMIHLPNEIIFLILLHLPAQILYNTMRHVSKTWQSIINNPHFIQLHLLNSTPVILQHKWTQSGTLNFQFITIKDNSLEFIDFPNINSKLTAQGSCNGLLLLHSFENVYCVMNPITGEKLVLPIHPTGSLNINLPGNGLAYDSLSKRFKVVHFYEDGENLYKRCSILTVGVDDEWREIDCRNLTGMIGKLFRKPSQILAGRFLYLFTEDFEYQVILDVETEKVGFLPAPENWRRGRRWEVAALGKGESFKIVFLVDMGFEIWVLEEIENGKWVKSMEIDLNGKRVDFGGRILNGGGGGGGGGDLIVVSCRRDLGFDDDIVYICLNVKTGEIWKWNAEPEVVFGCSLVHVNSLISLTSSK